MMMKVVYGLEKLPSSRKKIVLAIGMFDGVHKGHQKIIKTAVERAEEKGAKSVVITFDRHPAEIVKPDFHPPTLTPLDLKLKLFKELGVDLTVVIKFTKHLSNLEPDEFIRLIVSRFRIVAIVVGFNFHFGKNRIGDITFLRKYGLHHGFKVISIALVKQKGESISSTRVRRLLQSGNIAAVRSILGRNPLLWGKVIKGSGRGRQLGFHTANIKCLNSVSLPRRGVYAGYIRILPHTQRRKCVIAIGKAPTFKEIEARIEAHILDYKGNIYGKDIELEFLTRIRDEKTFPSGEALTEQVKKDIERTRKILKN